MPLTLQRELSVAEYCDRGAYEKAAERLDGWRGIGVRPARNGQSDREYAETLKWAAVITVELAIIKQIAIRDSARDMLTESARLSNSAEPLVWLGVCYGRCGEHGEAEILLRSCLLEDLEPRARFFCLRNLAVVIAYQSRLDEALRVLSEAERILSYAPISGRGKLYLQRGLIFRKLNNLDRAVADYEKAARCFEDDANARYEAAVSNNLAGVYMDQGNFPHAHAYAQRAVSLFNAIGDKMHSAKAWDQIARIYLCEKNLDYAERAARRAVSLVEKGEQGHVLAECLLTQGVIIAQRAAFEAAQVIQRAANICETIGDEPQKLRADQELNRILKDTKQLIADLTNTIRPIEHRVIKDSLIRHKGIVSKVSIELGIPKETVFKKIRTQFPDLMSDRRPVVERKKRKRKSRTPSANSIKPS